MKTIRVFHSTWDDETDKPTEGHTDYADAFISTDRDGVLLITRGGINVAAYNRWDRAIALPEGEAKDAYSAVTMKDLADDTPPVTAPSSHAKWRSSSVAS